MLPLGWGIFQVVRKLALRAQTVLTFLLKNPPACGPRPSHPPQASTRSSKHTKMSQSTRNTELGKKVGKNMYDSPHQFEPLIPTTILPALTDQAADIARAATRLIGMAHASSRQTIRECVRAMNS